MEATLNKQQRDVVALQERWGGAVMSGDLDVFDEILSPKFVDHDPAPDQGPGPDGLKSFFKKLRAAFTDLQVSPATMVPTDDSLALAYWIEGTHRGEFNGIAPTGKRIKIRGMQISRYENGVVVERWGSSDELGLLQQIGAKIGS